MRHNLKVPFAEKDEAKKLGARWDASRKVWYVAADADLDAFSRWSPTPHDGASGVSPAPKRGTGAVQASTGTVHVGARYVERPRVCDCLPWDDCDACRSGTAPRA